MTWDESLSVLAILKAAYPNFQKGLDKASMDAVVGLWADMFQDTPASLVAAAVKAYIAYDEKGFPPHIGAIRLAVERLTQPEEMGEMDAWGILHKAISRSSYHSAEEFEKLPPQIKRFVGSPSQLREWAMTPPETLGTVVQSNFMRAYRATSKAEKEMRLIPADVRAIAEKLKLESKGKMLLEEWT